MDYVTLLRPRTGSRLSGRALVCAMALVLVSAMTGPDSARASEREFERFVKRLWPAARSAGVSRRTFDTAFRDVTPDPEVLKRAERQPEFVTPIWEYLKNAVSKRRIEMGKKRLAEYRSVLDAMEVKYGVDRHVIIAIWGMETSYGTFLGDMNVIRSLATLAYRGSRKDFGRTQLLAALKILQQGDITAAKMTGSWAGAMGHTQFIPTTYRAHAVDFDGDGKRDIWNNIPDALASAANYLRVSKWRTGETWGYEVAVPRGFNYALSGTKTVKTLRQWQRLGLKRIRGQRFPRPGDRASLIVPAGARGPAFLVLNNFRSILRYNNATAYALAVGHLSDRIRGFPAFVRPWPSDDRPLARDQREELQRRLSAKGYATGGVDGVLGRQTRAAVRAYQRAVGLPVDGYPSLKLLERLRRDG